MTGMVTIYRNEKGGYDITSSIVDGDNGRIFFPNTVVSLIREIKGSKSFEMLEQSAIELALLVGVNLND